MIPEFFIAKRITYEKKDKQSIARPIIRLAMFAIALSVAVMIITIAVVTGFKKEIRDKVIGFASHVQIINEDSNISFETVPISREQDFLKSLQHIPGIKKIQVYATKPGLIRVNKNNQGIIAKGIDSDFDWNFFRQNLVEGDIFRVNDSVRTNEVLISRKIASMLSLKLHDKFVVHFIEKRDRFKVFEVCGIFETALEEFDKQYMIADIKHIQDLNNWEEDQISGFEIYIDDYKQIDAIQYSIHDNVTHRLMEDGSRLMVISIKDKYTQIFSWLNLLNMNVKVILAVMAFVAIINMTTGLIIIILDKTSVIGVLKALGATNRFTIKVFLYQASILIIKGMILGNIIALSLCFIQYKYHILKLDQASYFTNYVPLQFNIFHIGLINVSSLVLILLFMLLPVMVVMNINPVKTIRYN